MNAAEYLNSKDIFRLNYTCKMLAKIFKRRVTVTNWDSFDAIVLNSDLGELGSQWPSEDLQPWGFEFILITIAYNTA
jgi:hypothetical protein